MVERAVESLWSPQGWRARDWLHERGLADETLRAYSIGYISGDRYDDPAAWGLDGKKIWLPRGVALPWIETDGTIWGVRVRRPAGKPKYWSIKDSVLAIFGARHIVGRRTAALTADEFDAMLLRQEAGDLVDVATLGGAGTGLHPRARWHLLDASRVLVMLDGDKAGDDGARRLLAASPRMRHVALPDELDITDFFLAGGDLRRLVSDHLTGTNESTAPVADRERFWL